MRVSEFGEVIATRLRKWTRSGEYRRRRAYFRPAAGEVSLEYIHEMRVNVIVVVNRSHVDAGTTFYRVQGARRKTVRPEREFDFLD